MPPILRNGTFLFVLQSQPFYQAQLVPMMTISILGSSLARVEAKVSHFTKRDLCLRQPILESLARVDGEATYLSHAVHRRSMKWVLVYEEWMDKDGQLHFLTKKRQYVWMNEPNLNENEEIYQVVC